MKTSFSGPVNKVQCLEFGRRIRLPAALILIPVALAIISGIAATHGLFGASAQSLMRHQILPFLGKEVGPFSYGSLITIGITTLAGSMLVVVLVFSFRSVPPKEEKPDLPPILEMPPPPPKAPSRLKIPTYALTPSKREETPRLETCLKEQLLLLKSALLSEGSLSTDLWYLSLIQRFIPDLDAFREKLQSGDESKWNLFVKKIERLKTNAELFLGSKRNITWVTGTRSPSLVGIGRIAATHIGVPALAPSGQLLHEGLVPLTGELKMGLTGINDHSLSGVGLRELDAALRYANLNKFVASFENEKESIFSGNCSLARLKVAVLRLKYLGASKELMEEVKTFLSDLYWQAKNNVADLDFDNIPFGLIDQLVSDVHPEKIEQAKHPLPVGTFVNYCGRWAMVSSIRQSEGATDYEYSIWVREWYAYENRGFDTSPFYAVKVEQSLLTAVYPCESLRKNPPEVKKFSDKEYQLIRNELIDDRVNFLAIHEILVFADSEEMRPLTEEEGSFLEENFPLMFGSSSELPSDQTMRVRSGILGETGWKGVLRLGVEVDLIFTRKNRIKRVKEWLARHELSESVHVMTIGTGIFLSRYLSMTSSKLGCSPFRI